MRGKLIKKIELPKGYVSIDEVYEQLDRIEKEEDCEYGDYGEVLSKWATCDYGEVLDAISCCNVMQAISLDKVKQTREKIEKLKDEEIITYQRSEAPMEQYITEVGEGLELALDVLDELIGESEE